MASCRGATFSCEVILLSRVDGQIHFIQHDQYLFIAIFLYPNVWFTHPPKCAYARFVHAPENAYMSNMSNMSCMSDFRKMLHDCTKSTVMFRISQKLAQIYGCGKFFTRLVRDLYRVPKSGVSRLGFQWGVYINFWRHPFFVAGYASFIAWAILMGVLFRT